MAVTNRSIIDYIGYIAEFIATTDN